MLSQEVIIQIALSSALFIFLWIVFGKGMIAPFVALLDEREARTAGAEDAGHRKREEAAQVVVRVETALREARSRGILRRDDLVNASKGEAQRMLDAALERAQGELESARGQIREEKARAKAELAKEAAELSQLVVQRVMRSGDGMTIH